MMGSWPRRRIGGARVMLKVHKEIIPAMVSMGDERFIDVPDAPLMGWNRLVWLNLKTRGCV